MSLESGWFFCEFAFGQIRKEGAILREKGRVLLFLVLYAPALYSAGQTSGESLLIGVGARPLALGGAYTALANDLFAMAYNPAGLAYIKRPQLSFMHGEWLADIKEQYIAFGLPSKPGTIGLSFYRMDMGHFSGRDLSGQPTNEFSAGDLNFSLSFARQLHHRVLIGTKLSYFKEELAGYKASTYFGDFGLMTSLSPRVTLGAALQNMGSGLRFIQESSPLPFTYTLGAVYNVSVLRFSADFKTRPKESSRELALGVEFAPSLIGPTRPLTLRVGHAGLGATSQSTLPTHNLGMGFGLALGHLNTDYAFQPFGILGGIHRVSLTFKF